MNRNLKNHYDVGIAGVWFGGNYGSVLTYYALREVVTSMGYSVVMVDRPAHDHYDPKEFQGNHARMFAHAQGYDVLAVPDVHDMSHLNRYCDTFMVGSDQLWNYGIAKGFGPSFYLGFADNTKTLISYATSFGHGTSFTPKERISAITKYLQRFDAVSVRESEGVRVLKDEFGVRGTQVIDPIYLLNRTDYDKLIDPADTLEFPDNYLLAYVLGTSGEEYYALDKETTVALRNIAREKNLNLVVLADARKKLPDQVALDEMKRNLGTPHVYQCRNVSQWLGSIKNCQFMITDSFHGAGFGLIFGRQLLIQGNESRGMSRFYSLVDLFDIRNVLATSIKDIERLSRKKESIDYARFEAILEMEQKRSRDWLRCALENRHQQIATIGAIKQKECCGCMACVNACPVDCISMEPDAFENCLYPSIDSSKCIHCGKCLKSCPSANIVLDKERESTIYAAYTEEEVRMDSSSGAIFSLLAESVIEDGGVVFGAAYTHDFVLEQTSAVTAEQMPALRRSKYIQSQAMLTYREAKRHLKEGRPVLYAGCPCQIAGLNSYLGKEYDNLLTLDLLCHGGPTPFSFAKYLREEHGGKEILAVNFREKETFGWPAGMAIHYEDGESYIRKREDDTYSVAFLHCLSMRPHCQVCNYCRLPRQGDITLGDFWGVGKYERKHNQRLSDGMGTSIVSVNSQKGAQAYEKLSGRLAVSAEIDRNWVLTHGQPYANPIKSNPLRYRFQRMLHDVSFAKALDTCKKNEFDFVFLGMSPDSYGDILADYGLQRAIARSGNTVLMSNEPRDVVGVSDNPLKYRLTDFGNWFYPVVSAHETIEALRKTNYYAHGFIERKSLSYSYKICKYPKGVLDYERQILCNGGCPSLFLLTNEDWNRIIDDASQTPPSNPYIAVYMEDGSLPEKLANLPCANISQDMGIGDWVAKINAATLVATDREDGALVAAALEKPLLFIGSTDTLAQQYGVEAASISLDRLSQQLSLADLVSIASIPRTTRSSADTEKMLVLALSEYRTDTLLREIIPLRKRIRSLSGKILRRAKRYAKRVLRR